MKKILIIAMVTMMILMSSCTKDANSETLVFVSNDSNYVNTDSNAHSQSEAESKIETTIQIDKEPASDNDIVSPSQVHSVEDPSIETTSSGLTYVNGLLIVNKTYSLPADYNPGADPEATNHLWEMISAASNEGISIYINSGFRTYADQDYLYKDYVNTYGQEVADSFSAKPGHSEHQSGLAFDLNEVNDSFAETEEAHWLADNSWKYGFILRYPFGKENITGYKYESWHFRYVGLEYAEKIYNSGLCLEEYFGITSQYAD